MYIDYAQTLIVIILILAAIVLIGGLLWAYNNSGNPQDSSAQSESDLITIREIMTNDSHLHRLLMIEIISDKPSSNNNIHFNQYQYSQSSITQRLNRSDFKINSHNEISSKTIGTPNIKDDKLINDSTSQDSIINSRDSNLIGTSRFPMTVGWNNSSMRDELPPETITFNKMSIGMSLLGKSLIRSFGITISQRIATLMHKRNEIIRDYYWSMRNVICNNGNCIHIVEIPNTEESPNYCNSNTCLNNDKFEESTSTDSDTLDELTSNSSDKPKIIISPLTPGSTPIQSINSKDPAIWSKLDITTITNRKLEAITREITDNIAASFQIRDVDQTSHKRPLLHYQRFFNLLTMYDKELINQAKSYASHHYDISMNCAQSSLELTHHISDELNILMKESHQKLKTIP
jgi:hypothetical protein